MKVRQRLHLIGPSINSVKSTSGIDSFVGANGLTVNPNGNPLFNLKDSDTGILYKLSLLNAGDATPSSFVISLVVAVGGTVF
ncbi:hypothetical protein WICMUC_001634 [Wickerhamomyces mucosus]|uniref:Uncharacterized protein n=1 Tax=Wickerhamomyces mucosus TaxID=1378264 RepID=A0A9P8PV65_9ASCO|nr:hypothetical protein WICMUC_001634 [Wickerhamomyces mucosus]